MCVSDLLWVRGLKVNYIFVLYMLLLKDVCSYNPALLLQEYEATPSTSVNNNKDI